MAIVGPRPGGGLFRSGLPTPPVARRAHVDRLDYVQRSAQYHPVGRDAGVVGGYFEIVAVERQPAAIGGQSCDDGRKVEVFVRDMERNHASVGNLPAVQGERLPGQEVCRDRVPGEGIDDQQIERFV